MIANWTKTLGLLALCFAWSWSYCLGAEPELEKQLQQLQKANELLQQRLQDQQKLIEGLSKKVSALEGAKAEPASKEEEPTPPASQGFTLGKVRIGGEGGVGFFRSGSAGPYPNSEFRADEGRIFVEAPLWDDTYFFSEINLIQREDNTEPLKLGELYVDFENVSRLWNKDGQLSLRIGRLDIPFGEEYMVRDAIDNPLITHSLSDLWGVDEGVEIYGGFKKFSYVLAVQNGGHPTLRDYNSDKSITARLSLDPTPSLHLSLSGMRTGGLDVQNDRLSELWFGNGFIRSLGGPGTTVFRGEVVEGDVRYRLPRGHLKGAGGALHYADNDSPNNRRWVYYYYAEGVHHLTRQLYLAARWSQILAPDGFPIVGNSTFADYFYGSLTTELWRLSLGGGWKFSDNLVAKAEYTFENGKTPAGKHRNHQNMVSTEVVFRF